MTQTNDLHVASFEPLVPPGELLDELPLGEAGAQLVAHTRQNVRDVLGGIDDRLLVVVGPCSAHDPVAALDYAGRLAAAARRFSDELCLVMRVYFEKPRTTMGWKGLINDPGLDGTYDVQRGLRTARKLLLDILDLGVPVGCEFLEPTSPQYIADTVTWGAIGARTTESPSVSTFVRGWGTRRAGRGRSARRSPRRRRRCRRRRAPARPAARRARSRAARGSTRSFSRSNVSDAVSAGCWS